MILQIISLILFIGFIWFCYEIITAPNFENYSSDDDEF